MKFLCRGSSKSLKVQNVVDELDKGMQDANDKKTEYLVTLVKCKPKKKVRLLVQLRQQFLNAASRIEIHSIAFIKSKTRFT